MNKYPSFLITQCLQNDFIKPIEIHEPIPNLLHIGFEESKRLMGEVPSEGLLMKLMEWAYKTSSDDLQILNIRDWHDPRDPFQKKHLEQFGFHCIQDTFGAEFVFEPVRNPKKDVVISSIGLNDFLVSNIEELFDQYKGLPVKVGIIGVWTEAKVTHLAYEISTRYPEFQLTICSALTASSSTQMHFVSLEQIKKILGIPVVSSVNEFALFLSGKHIAHDEQITSSKANPAIKVEGETNLGSEDEQIIRYLFRNSKSIDLKVLDGGFSGNLVLKSKALDLYGHEEVPSVTKIGERNSIAHERDSFEKIKNILGNSAPQIVDYAETNNRAGIKYRYASMLDEKVSTFQARFAKEDNIEKLKGFLNVVFRHQLSRFYKAASREKIDLFKYYDFSDKYVASIKRKVEEISGSALSENGDVILEGENCYNLLKFYTHDLKLRNPKLQYSHYLSYLHGDLNGANIILDGHENVWLIDFFHTHRGHVLKDLIKLENDILYIYTKVDNLKAFEEAKKLVHALTDIEDLWNPVNEVNISEPSHKKTIEIIKFLRSFYKDLILTDRDPIQLFIGLLRYSVHTMSFDECNQWQKKLALYTSCHLAHKLSQRIQASNELHFNYLSPLESNLAITILPGRKDRDRSMENDLNHIKNSGFDTVVTLLSKDEYHHYGVPDLVTQYHKYGINCFELSIIDQGTPSIEDMKKVTKYINTKLNNGSKVLMHCVGGLGRSGMVAACYLKEYKEVKSEESIQLIREARSKRAIESKVQEEFVRNYLN
jgi:protein-tyrosine phosphatase